MRHFKTGVLILNDPLCTDDFGIHVHQCQYTNKLAWANDSIMCGPCVPQISGSYVCASDALPVFRKSKKLFDEMDANCNTCRHLQREKHPKNSAGILYGGCYMRESFGFHPDDFMGMECWEART